MLLNLPNLRRVIFLEHYPDEQAAELWKKWQQNPSNVYWLWKP
jgi:hypothetical protein